MSLRTATLLRARPLSSTVRELTLLPDGPFTFEPGQWVSLRVPVQGEAEPLKRAYSIASAPRDDGAFDLAVTRVEGGPGSTFLHALQPGARVELTEAQGFFTMPAPLPRPVLLVGTGTGVAPLRAMLHAALAQGVTTPFVLLFGVRTPEDILYREDFEALAAAHPTFRFEPSLSRPTPDWRGRAGYVQTHVPDLAASLGACDAYVCGLSRMVTAVRHVLKTDLGFPRQQIHTERYD